MTPTSRLYGLMAIGGGVAATIQGINPTTSASTIWLWMLAFDGLLLGLMLLDGLLVTRAKRPTVKREPLHRLSIGRDNQVTITIATKANRAQLQIYDRYPNQLGDIAMPLRADCAAKTTSQVSYTLHPQQRGEFQWGDLDLRQRGPLRLAWRGWRIPQAQAVAVYPDLVGLEALSLQLAIQSTGTVRQRKRIGIGTEFAELREYGIGDDPRMIDWKATARRSTPLVRVLEPEREQTLIVLLDRGRLMTARVNGLSRFDWGLNATLSLALAGLHRGDRVGVGVFDRQMQTWVPPTGGQQHLQHLIKTLAPIKPVLLESDYLGAVTQVAMQQHRRALVVVITDIVDQTASAELLTALTRLKARHLPFCVTLRDPQVDHQADHFETAVAEAYGRAVAIDLLNQRQIAFAQLKQSGVLVLDAPANQIREPLIDNYLRIKARNRL